ncbi:hypothetical protein VUR80DRAFT_4437 [Thermomyces stellatus]
MDAPSDGPIARALDKSPSTKQVVHSGRVQVSFHNLNTTPTGKDEDSRLGANDGLSVVHAPYPGVVRPSLPSNPWGNEARVLLTQTRSQQRCGVLITPPSFPVSTALRSSQTSIPRPCISPQLTRPLHLRDSVQPTPGGKPTYPHTDNFFFSVRCHTRKRGGARYTHTWVCVPCYGTGGR